jgi:4-diphosphocytidyl-2-C-methyl-D-erythritol kinase
MITFPNCKINLGLHIANKRDDGFHNIESVFYPIPKHDVLEVLPLSQSKNSTKITFQTHGIPVSGNWEQNLIVRAYRLLDSLFDLPPVTACLYKALPMGAGLGGGSSDAAHMLLLLNDMFELNQTNEQLVAYASQLGSDCSFFISNKPAYLFGKGHELQLIDFSLTGYTLVLLAPPYHSNTALSYKYSISRNTDEPTLMNILSNPIHKWKSTLVNDFEQSVFVQFPELLQLKNKLYEAGAVYASMSGSGSCIFGLFNSSIKALPNELAKHVIFNSVLP